MKAKERKIQGFCSSSKLSFTMVLLLLLCSCSQEKKEVVTPQTESTIFSYVPPVYTEIPLGEIKPQGWLRDQLQTMADNSTGHMDEIYDKIKNDNGWLGGKGDNWEETPYWLDGAVPLAYQLDDKRLQEKVLKYINWSLDNQRPSGYFGAITDWERETGKQIDIKNCDKGQDWWPKMVMLKVIKQYYTTTNDKRVIPFMTKYFKYQDATLDKCPIDTWTEWAKSRGADNVKMVQWLYGITGDKSLLALADNIEGQSFTWSKWFGERDWVINAAARPDGKAWMTRHGVNVGMALKSPAENYQRTGDSTYIKSLKTGFGDLMSLHGLPNGIFSADEDLHGNAPTQGTELCAIVETMFSLEDIIGITGDPYYMDALERTAFNAMPPQTTDDYNEKQYFQIANQIEIQKGVFAFTLPFSREMNNVLGAKSGYTCCYVNMHQGWTKFTQHLWYGTKDKGLAALVYSPNTITTKVGKPGHEITIQEDTEYPFGDTVKFSVTTKDSVVFPLQLRIPSWCDSPELTVNGEKIDLVFDRAILTLKRTWKNGDIVNLKLPMEIKVSEWAENSKAVERGPLVYGLKLDQKWAKGIDEKEGPYFTISTKDDWNYGLLQNGLEDLKTHAKVESKPLNDNFKWNLENSPLQIKLQAKKIPDWKAINGLAYLPVSGRDGVYKGDVNDKVEEITLVPIGFTKLRIVAFPVVK